MARFFQLRDEHIIFFVIVSQQPQEPLPVKDDVNYLIVLQTVKIHIMGQRPFGRQLVFLASPNRLTFEKKALYGFRSRTPAAFHHSSNIVVKTERLASFIIIDKAFRNVQQKEMFASIVYLEDHVLFYCINIIIS